MASGLGLYIAYN